MSWLSAIARRYRVSEDPLRSLRRLELLALALGMLLCLQLAWGGLRLATLAAPEPVEPAADSLQVPVVRAPAIATASERNEIIGRPLFWSSRRPLDAVATLAEPEGTPGELKGVQLVGLFGSGDQAGIIALVKGEKRRILLGDTVEGWTLKSITPYELVVANGERTETLALQQRAVETKIASKNKAAKREGEVKPYPGASMPQTAKQPGAGGGAKRQPGTGPGNESRPAAPKPEAERTLGLGPQG